MAEPRHGLKVLVPTVLGIPVTYLTVLTALFYALLIFERRGRGSLSVLVVLGVVVADATLYADTLAALSRSLLHPHLLGQNFRLTQLVIPMAIVSRLMVVGFPRRRLDAAVLLWCAFFGWLLLAAVVGFLAGHRPPLIVRQAALLVHLGGGMALAATVPLTDYLTGRALRRFLQATAVVAGVMFVLDVFGFRLYSTRLPQLPLVGFGTYGADAATIFSALGLLGICLVVVMPPHLGGRLGLMIPSLVLLLSHLASPQRASRYALYLSVGFLLVAFLAGRGRERLQFRPVEGWAVAVGITVILLSGVFAASVLSNLQAEPDELLAGVSGNTGLGPNSRQGSVESRYNQWDVVRGRILSQPLTGEGLGGTFVHYDEGSKSYVESDIAHNIVLDLLRRTGVVGVLLGGFALLVVVLGGLSVWWRHSSDFVAAMSLAAVAITGALVARGMVESIFEKNRLSTLLGVALGIALSAFWSLRDQNEDPARYVEPHGAERTGVVVDGSG